MISLSELNSLPVSEFVSRLAGVFEHSPWVAERVAAARPFESRGQLLDLMRATVEMASEEEKWTLIRAHPQLGVRGFARSHLTELSSREQKAAGLDECANDDVTRLAELNTAYHEKFSMPFIMAVRGHTARSIIANFEKRMANDLLAERDMALHQIGVIADCRLADLIADEGG